MSIAVVVDTFPRWSERFIARELNELKRRGVQFSIYCLKAGDAAGESDPEFADLIQHRVVLPACFVPSAARELGMDAAGRARVKLVEKELGLGAFRKIGCANSLAKLIREHGHKKVYAHFASLPSTLGWLASEALKLPLVLSFHARDVFVEDQLLNEKRATAKRVFLCNEKAIDHLKDRFFAAGENPQNIDLMHHGLPLELYEFQERDLGAGRQEIKVLAAGRLVPKKGFETLLEAVASNALKDLNVKLTLLGEGPEQKKLERKISELNLGGRVSMPGAVSGSEMMKHYAAADVFAMPSREVENDSDGIPNVVLEAMALGLPVVATTTISPELRQVLCQSGQVDADDAQSLAAAICGVVRYPDHVAEKTRAARAMIEAEFDIRKNIEPLVRELAQ